MYLRPYILERDCFTTGSIISSLLIIKNKLKLLSILLYKSTVKH
jgi:hypothetical protein